MTKTKTNSLKIAKVVGGQSPPRPLPRGSRIPPDHTTQFGLHAPTVRKRQLAHKRILSNHGIRKQAANVAKVKAQKKRAKTYERVLAQHPRIPPEIAEIIAWHTVNRNNNNTKQHKRVKK